MSRRSCIHRYIGQCTNTTPGRSPPQGPMPLKNFDLPCGPRPRPRRRRRRVNGCFQSTGRAVIRRRRRRAPTPVAGRGEAAGHYSRGRCGKMRCPARRRLPRISANWSGSTRAGREEDLMAKQCDVCGKSTVFGKNVSHAHNVTSRTWEPNLQRVARPRRRQGAADRGLHPLPAQRPDRQGAGAPVAAGSASRSYGSLALGRLSRPRGHGASPRRLPLDARPPRPSHLPVHPQHTRHRAQSPHQLLELLAVAQLADDADGGAAGLVGLRLDLGDVAVGLGDDLGQAGQHARLVLGLEQQRDLVERCRFCASHSTSISRSGL